MAENVFRHAHRVTYAECTIGNHVYYARYLDILEEARGEFFRKLGQPLLRWQQGDVGLPVAECQVRYRVPARYDDVLQVEVTVIQLSRVRVTFNYSIWKGEGELVLEASTVHFAAGADEKPKRIPEELAAVLNEVLAGREGKSQKLETPRPDGNS